MDIFAKTAIETLFELDESRDPQLCTGSQFASIFLNHWGHWVTGDCPGYSWVKEGDTLARSPACLSAHGAVVIMLAATGGQAPRSAASRPA